MNTILIIAVAVLALALAALATAHFRSGARRPARVQARGSRRILFPFVAYGLSNRALDAALRLARAEDATLVPVFLARVALDLPLDAPLPHQSEVCLPLQEAIEQRASGFGIPVDSRIERGRTYRHALREAIDHERFDRIVVSAASNGSPGFNPEDVAWLLDNAPGEIIVLRPGSSDELMVQPSRPRKRSIGTLSRRVSRNTARKTVLTT